MMSSRKNLLYYLLLIKIYPINKEIKFNHKANILGKIVNSDMSIAHPNTGFLVINLPNNVLFQTNASIRIILIHARHLFVIILYK